MPAGLAVGGGGGGGGGGAVLGAGFLPTVPAGFAVAGARPVGTGGGSGEHFVIVRDGAGQARSLTRPALGIYLLFVSPLAKMLAT